MPFEMDLKCLLEMAEAYGRLREAEKRWQEEKSELLARIYELKEIVSEYEEDERERRKERLANV